MTGFVSAQKQKFTEIDVEQRINIIEREGRVRMIITDKEQSLDLIVGGEDTNRRRKEIRSAGMYFYNENGVENGGLIFNSAEENGNRLV